MKYTDLGNGSASDYERSLDLTTGIAGVEFDAGGRHIAREFFASHPDKVVVGRLEASGKAGVNVEITFPSKQAGAKVSASGNQITMTGAVQDNQLKYASVLKVVANGGNVKAQGDKLVVSGATTLRSTLQRRRITRMIIRFIAPVNPMPSSWRACRRRRTTPWRAATTPSVPTTSRTSPRS